MVHIVWRSMRLAATGLVTLWIGVPSLAPQQLADAQKAQQDSSAGKIAWQYDTGG